jgi:hypothetical protein
MAGHIFAYPDVFVSADQRELRACRVDVGMTTE